MPMMSSSRSQLYVLPREREMKEFFIAKVSRPERMGIFALVKPPAQARVRCSSLIYTIQVPWHVFGAFLRFQAGIAGVRAGIWFLNRKPVTKYDPVYYSGLPNVSSNGRICYGAVSLYYKLRPRTFMERLYQKFWQTRFNGEIRPNYAPFKDKYGVMVTDPDDLFKKWEGATQKNLPIEWIPDHWMRTIDRAIHSLAPVGVGHFS